MFVSNSKAGSHSPDSLRGLAAGLLAGLVASYAMNAFQTATSRLSQPAEPKRPRRKTQGYEDSDLATAKVASVLSENVLHHRLSPYQKDIADPAVHYAVGAALGGLYGVAAEFAPQVTAGAGLPFGTAVAVVLDEGVVPAVGLSAPPWDSSASTHLYSLSSHLVFGLTVELVRRGTRSLLS
jgi:putative membrane protein